MKLDELITQIDLILKSETDQAAELQALKVDLGGPKKNEEYAKKRIKNWINTVFLKIQNPNAKLESLARQLALYAVDDDVLKAVNLLNPRSVPKVSDKITLQEFIDGHYLTLPGQPSSVMTPLPKNWKKGISNPGMLERIKLYEKVMFEKMENKHPTAAQKAMYVFIDKLYDKDLNGTQALVAEQRKKNSILMINPEEMRLPMLNSYWQSLVNYYGQAEASTSVSMDLGKDPTMGLGPVDNVDPVSELRQAREKLCQTQYPQTAEGLSQKIADQTMLALIDEALSEYEKCKGNIADFLKKRKQTTTDVGYTAAPYSPLNLFCARLALNESKNKPNPRETFWKMLYPKIGQTWMGQNDKDWPNYGEAIYTSRGLVNYVKLARMCQSRDVYETLIQGNRSSDPEIQNFLNTHPHFWRFSRDEWESIEKFNEAETVYWQSKKYSGDSKIKNFYDFFVAMGGVLNEHRYRGNAQVQDARLEEEMTERGTLDIMPFVQTLFSSGIVQVLEGYSKTLPPESQTIIHVHNLIKLRSRFTNWTKDQIHSCYNITFKAISGALADETLVAFLKGDSCKFKTQELAPWEQAGKGQYRDQRPASLADEKVLREILNSAQSAEVLFKLISLLQGKGKPLPIDLIVTKMKELSKTLSLTQIYTFLYENKPSSSQYTLVYGTSGEQLNSRDFFETLIQAIFAEGIPKEKLKTIGDCVLALKLHHEFGVPGNKETVKYTVYDFRLGTNSIGFIINPESRILVARLLSDPYAISFEGFSNSVRMLGFDFDRVNADFVYMMNLIDPVHFESSLKILCFNRVWQDRRIKYVRHINGSTDLFVQFCLKYPESIDKQLILYKQLCDIKAGPSINSSRIEPSSGITPALVAGLLARRLASLQPAEFLDIIQTELTTDNLTPENYIKVLDCLLGLANSPQVKAYDSLSTDLNQFKDKMSQLLKSEDFLMGLVREDCEDMVDEFSPLKRHFQIELPKTIEAWCERIKPDNKKDELFADFYFADFIQSQDDQLSCMKKIMEAFKDRTSVLAYPAAAVLKSEALVSALEDTELNDEYLYHFFELENVDRVLAYIVSMSDKTDAKKKQLITRLYHCLKNSYYSYSDEGFFADRVSRNLSDFCEKYPQLLDIQLHLFFVLRNTGPKDILKITQYLRLNPASGITPELMAGMLAIELADQDADRLFAEIWKLVKGKNDDPKVYLTILEKLFTLAKEPQKNDEDEMTQRINRFKRNMQGLFTQKGFISLYNIDTSVKVDDFATLGRFFELTKYNTIGEWCVGLSNLLPGSNFISLTVQANGLPAFIESQTNQADCLIKIVKALNLEQLSEVATYLTPVLKTSSLIDILSGDALVPVSGFSPLEYYAKFFNPTNIRVILELLLTDITREQEDKDKLISRAFELLYKSRTWSRLDFFVELGNLTEDSHIQDLAIKAGIETTASCSLNEFVKSLEQLNQLPQIKKKTGLAYVTKNKDSILSTFCDNKKHALREMEAMLFFQFISLIEIRVGCLDILSKALSVCDKISINQQRLEAYDALARVLISLISKKFITQKDSVSFKSTFIKLFYCPSICVKLELLIASINYDPVSAIPYESYLEDCFSKLWGIDIGDEKQKEHINTLSQCIVKKLLSEHFESRLKSLIKGVLPVPILASVLIASADKFEDPLITSIVDVFTKTQGSTLARLATTLEYILNTNDEKVSRRFQSHRTQADFLTLYQSLYNRYRGDYNDILPEIKKLICFYEVKIPRTFEEWDLNKEWDLFKNVSREMHSNCIWLLDPTQWYLDQRAHIFDPQTQFISRLTQKEADRLLMLLENVSCKDANLLTLEEKVHFLQILLEKPVDDEEWMGLLESVFRLPIFGFRNDPTGLLLALAKTTQPQKLDLFLLFFLEIYGEDKFGMIDYCLGLKLDLFSPDQSELKKKVLVKGIQASRLTDVVSFLYHPRFSQYAPGVTQNEFIALVAQYHPDFFDEKKPESSLISVDLLRLYFQAFESAPMVFDTFDKINKLLSKCIYCLSHLWTQSRPPVFDLNHFDKPINLILGLKELKGGLTFKVFRELVEFSSVEKTKALIARAVGSYPIVNLTHDQWFSLRSTAVFEKQRFMTDLLLKHVYEAPTVDSYPQWIDLLKSTIGRFKIVGLDLKDIPQAWMAQIDPMDLMNCVTAGSRMNEALGLDLLRWYKSLTLNKTSDLKLFISDVVRPLLSSFPGALPDCFREVYADDLARLKAIALLMIDETSRGGFKFHSLRQSLESQDPNKPFLWVEFIKEAEGDDLALLQKAWDLTLIQDDNERINQLVKKCEDSHPFTVTEQTKKQGVFSFHYSSSQSSSSREPAPDSLRAKAIAACTAKHPQPTNAVLGPSQPPSQ